MPRKYGLDCFPSCLRCYPFDERLKVIQERCRKGDTAKKILCVEALQKLLSMIERFTSMSGQHLWQPDCPDTLAILRRTESCTST